MEKNTLPRVAAVIVAAGYPTKDSASFPSKDTNKDTVLPDFSKKFGSITALQRMIKTLQRIEADPIVVVTGYHAELIQKQASSLHVVCIYNENWKTSDMFASAKLGLSYVKDLCDVVFFTPANVPLFSTDTVATLLSSGSLASIPEKNGRKGHPLLLQSSLIPKLLDYTGEGGITGALRFLGIERHSIPVEDDGVLFNTKHHSNCIDWEPLVLKHNSQPFHMDVTITFSQEIPFFDPYTASLLTLIERTQSVRSACKQMNLSYSKGWNLLNAMEDQLHFAVIVRNPGGVGGGSTYLTPKGKLFLERYKQLIKEVSAFSKEAYQRIYPDKF